MHSAQTSAAVQLSWLTAHLYGEQISIGVIALTQPCCEPDLHSTTGHSGMLFASVAVHW